MIFFGHLGVGTELIAQVKNRSWIRSSLSLKWIILGTILPDLIDKPLYYGLSWSSGLHGSELGLISGTRTLAHSFPLAIILWIFFRRWRPPIVDSLFLGAISHYILDIFVTSYGVYLMGGQYNYLWEGFLFPILGLHFPIHPFKSSIEHAHQLFSRVDLYLWEIIGLWLIYKGFIKRAWMALVGSSDLKSK